MQFCQENKYYSLQTVQTLMKCHIMWHFIRVFPVCQSSVKGLSCVTAPINSLPGSTCNYLGYFKCLLYIFSRGHRWSIKNIHVLINFPIIQAFEHEMLHTLCKLEPLPCLTTCQFMTSSCHILNDVFFTHHVVHSNKIGSGLPMINHLLSS